MCHLQDILDFADDLLHQLHILINFTILYCTRELWISLLCKLKSQLSNAVHCRKKSLFRFLAIFQLALQLCTLRLSSDKVVLVVLCSLCFTISAFSFFSGLLFRMTHLRPHICQILLCLVRFLLKLLPPGLGHLVVVPHVLKYLLVCCRTASLTRLHHSQAFCELCYRHLPIIFPFRIRTVRLNEGFHVGEQAGWTLLADQRVQHDLIGHLIPLRVSLASICKGVKLAGQVEIFLNELLVRLPDAIQDEVPHLFIDISWGIKPVHLIVLHSRHHCRGIWLRQHRELLSKPAKFLEVSCPTICEHLRDPGSTIQLFFAQVLQSKN
mmetsp:Transcript_32726/g.74814  ORF Transcript_32726/g.74814 Transcript_32726/m.74814 type:complete len:324 (-) Transcript_32726:290-1261(-)